MFDTHAHVNFNAFKNDSEEILKEAEKNNLGMILVGSQMSTSERAVEMAELFKNVYAAVAMHPFHLREQKITEQVDTDETFEVASKPEIFEYEKYSALAKSSRKVVAVGESGLDYFRLEKDADSKDIDEIKEKQKELFRENIRLANELNLPMLIHCREAYEDLTVELKAHDLKRKGVVHCFLGNMEQAKKFLNMGFYLGFTGIITFKNVQPELLEVIKEISESRILAETDCPYLAPVPHRGKRNEPKYVEFIVKKIAEIKGWTNEKAEKITDNNAATLFNL